MDDKIKICRKELIALLSVEPICDYGDIGNVIGMIMGKYFTDEIGYTKDEFLSGIKHGISLADGTH